MADEKQRTIPEQSIETQLLRRRFGELKPGEEVSFEQLEELTGIKNRLVLYQRVATAKKTCRSEDSMVIVNVRGKGYRRLKNDEVGGHSDAARKRVRRIHRGERLNLSTVILEELTPTQQIAHIAKASYHAMGEATARERAMDKLVTAVEADGKGRLPLAKTLEAFK